MPNRLIADPPKTVLHPKAPAAPDRKIIPSLPASVMAKLAEAGERLGGRQLAGATRDEIDALFKKKAA